MSNEIQLFEEMEAEDGLNKFCDKTDKLFKSYEVRPHAPYGWLFVDIFLKIFKVFYWMLFTVLNDEARREFLKNGKEHMGTHYHKHTGRFATIEPNRSGY